MVLKLVRRHCLETWCIALSLRRFAPFLGEYYPYLPRPWPSWWLRLGHPHIDAVRLGQPAGANQAPRRPLWSTRRPAGADQWMYAAPKQGRWRAGYLYDPRISVIDPDTHSQCAAAFFTYASPADQGGRLSRRTVLVRLRRCYRLLDDERVRPGRRHRHPPATMLPQSFRRPASDTPMAWHANPEGVWFPGYAFSTQQTAVIRGLPLKVSYFVYFHRRDYQQPFHHGIWRVRTTFCRRGTADLQHTLPDLSDTTLWPSQPLPQSAGLPRGAPTRSDLDWDIRHSERRRGPL